MNATNLQARLQRLDGYLVEDPDNQSLLLDAFETARQLQDWEQASTYVQQALRHRPDGAWKLRAGELALAQLKWDEAASWFDSVRHDPATDKNLCLAAQHQLAEVMLHTGRPDVGIELLANRLEGNAGEAESAPASQVLWLRLLHRVGRLQDAVDSAKQWETAGHLAPIAAGVASLAALDLDRLDLAGAWATAALQAGHRQFEALITQASVALGCTDATGAHALISEALRLNPRDGRSWSMLAFADLLMRQFDQAVEHFETSLRFMPDHVGTWHGLAWTLILLNDLPRARLAFEHTIEMDRNFAESHGGLAVVLALAGDRVAARTAIDTARRLDRTCLTSRYAESVLAGEHRDSAQLRQLVARLLSGRGVLSDQAVQRLLQQR